MTIATTDFTTEAEATRDAADWREASSALIEFWTALDRSFSSGEIAACLRTHRMDLRFSVTSLGEYVRDLFYQGALPSYDDGASNPLSPVQVSRYTVGDGRTPAGVLVFVYGPDQATAETHGFEVDIPRPGNLPADGIGPSVSVPTPTTPVDSGPRPVPSNLPSAYVNKDTRCYVARKVVDAYLGTANIALRQGDSLYVSFDGTATATIRATETPGSKAYNIWQGTGRVSFYAPNGTPFVNGTKYPVSVNDDCITVDLANPC